MTINRYYDESGVNAAVTGGAHREIVGGMWDELGELQLSFLKSEGLKPNDHLIDIGCGSLRGGVRFVEYLESGRYFGIDISQALLDAGYDREIGPAGLAPKLPRANLQQSGDFNIAMFDVSFDFGLAQSVFTHLPLDYLERCLTAAAPVFVPGGRLYVTFFEVPTSEYGTDYTQPFGGITTRGDRDPFHVTRDQLTRLMDYRTDWQVDLIGDWGHPRNQKIARFERI